MNDSEFESRFLELTERQFKILAYRFQNKELKDIAERLSLSESGVKGELSVVWRMFGISEALGDKQKWPQLLKLLLPTYKGILSGDPNTGWEKLQQMRKKRKRTGKEKETEGETSVQPEGPAPAGATQVHTEGAPVPGTKGSTAGTSDGTTEQGPGTRIKDQDDTSGLTPPPPPAPSSKRNWWILLGVLLLNICVTISLFFVLMKIFNVFPQTPVATSRAQASETATLTPSGAVPLTATLRSTQRPYPTDTLYPTNTPRPTYTIPPTETRPALPTLSPTPQATPTSAVSLPFVDSFDQRARPEWQTVAGTWRVVNGRFTPQSVNTWQIAVVGDENWADYTIDVDAFSDEWIFPVRVIVRQTDAGYLAFLASYLDPTWVLVRGTTEETIGTGQARNERYKTLYKIRVTVKGDIYTGYINGAQVLQVEDGTFTHGKVGLGFDNPGMYAGWFDNFQVH